MLKNKNYLETVSMESQHQVLLHSYVNTAVVDECIVCTYFTRTFLSLHRACCVYIHIVRVAWHVDGLAGNDRHTYCEDDVIT